MSNEMQATNLLPFSNAQNVHPDMARIKDESHENGSIRANQGTPPESPCMNGNNATAPTSSGNSNGNPNANLNKEQDRFLPIANVGRIMKKVIPTNGKISKDAKETVQECVSEFISFITGEASDKCQREKRKTINGDDIIWAITSLGFEDYVNPLKLYLNKYREIEGEKLNVPKQPQQHQHQHQHQHQQRSVGSDQQQQQLQHPRMHPYPHFQRADQMGMLGANVGGLAPYPNPVGVFTSQRTLAHQTQYVGTEQGFSSPFSPSSNSNSNSNSNSLQKPYHQNIEQIDSVGHW